MSTQTYTSAPLTEIHIDEITLRLPRGFSAGDVCIQPGGNYRYVIRNRDGAAVIVRPTPCADAVPSMSRLRRELHDACDRAKETR
jgi:hypothetical protein